MPKSDEEYAKALEGPAAERHVRALDQAESEAADARSADRTDRFVRRAGRRGGSGPHTGL